MERPLFLYIVKDIIHLRLCMTGSFVSLQSITGAFQAYFDPDIVS